LKSESALRLNWYLFQHWRNDVGPELHFGFFLESNGNSWANFCTLKLKKYEEILRDTLLSLSLEGMKFAHGIQRWGPFQPVLWLQLPKGDPDVLD
jgi:hypothetical protein